MIQTDQQLLTYSCAHLAHRYVILRGDKLCGDQMHSRETKNEPLLGSNLPAQHEPHLSSGLFQKAHLSPEGLWVKPGTCPHLQLALCCSLQIRTWTQSLTVMVRQPSQGSYSEPGLPEEATSFRGTASMSISYVSSRSLFFRESPVVTVAGGLGPFTKRDGPKVYLP